jgi:hypothetical protein
VTSTTAFDLFPLDHYNVASHPRKVFIRYFIYAILTTAILTLGNMLAGDFHLYKLTGFVLVGWSVALWWWIGEVIWQLMVMPMLGNSPRITYILSRIPFWYMAGAIGYTLGLLYVQRLCISYVYDIPVKPIFLFGGLFGVLMQGAFYGVAYWTKRTHAHMKGK